jgi:pimeloyl-ACP methyl ester carboxylesterase
MTCDSSGHHLSLNNTRTGDVYTAIGMISSQGASDGFGNDFGDDGGFGNDFGDDFSGDDPFNGGNGGGNDAPLFYCECNMMYLISFRSGKVQLREDAISSGEAFAQNLVDAIIKDGRDYRGIILAGHSEGGTIAEATALAFLRGSRDLDSRKFYLLSTGSQLWMYEDERQEIMSEFSGRFMSFVNTKTIDNEVVFDEFSVCVHNDEGDSPYADAEVTYKDRFVSLPKTFLLPAPVTFHDRLTMTTRKVQLSDGTLVRRATPVQTLGIHEWKYYGAALAQHFTGGKSRAGSVIFEVASMSLLAATMMMSLLGGFT